MEGEKSERSFIERHNNSMKFLLTAVNAKYIHSNPAVYSLRAYAGKELEEHIEIAEYTINQRMEQILAGIYEKKPDVIAFSCYIWNWNVIQELLNEIPKVLPEVPIWLGGPEVSFCCEEILKQFPAVTGIMIGEGEQTFKELLEYYVNKTENLAEIKGLLLAYGRTGERELTDISTLPFLYEDMEQFKNRIIYYESSRGCPYRCSYCLSSIDKKVRLRDIEIVKKELQFFLDRQVAQVKFIDRTFNCNHRHALEIWNYIYEHDNGITNFHFEVEGDILNDEEIALLNKMRPGLVQLEIGVQSTNPVTFREINRFTDFEHLKVIVERISNGKNIHQHLDLIAGLPYEDYDSFAKSFNDVYLLRPNQLQLGFLKVLKGSLMYEKAEEYGIFYTEKPPYEVLYSKWLSYEDVLRLKKIEEMVEIYYNSNQFTHTLSVLERAFPHPFALFEKLADYYEENGYFTNSPARAYRYEVLLGFVRSVDAEHEKLYRELLTFDMYLRENLKSRPSFAGETEPEKERIRNFYRNEEENPCYLKGYEGYNSRQTSKMTHMEPFVYPVWMEDGEKILAYASAMAQEAETKLVLFDYQKRNPLNSEAAFHIVEE